MAFQESFVDVDGFRIRIMAAGSGPALVHLHGAGGLRLNAAHDLLAQRFRVIAFEMPGFGTEANQRTKDVPELAATMAGEPLYRACGYLPIERLETDTRSGVRVPLIRMGKRIA